jgi:hypothetical protein
MLTPTLTPILTELLLAALCPAAQAAPLSAPLAELLAVGEVTADGETPVTLYLILLDEAGAVLPGLEAKVTADRRPLPPLEPLGGGLYRTTWTPPAGQLDRDAVIDLRAKTEDKRKLKRAWGLKVRAPVPAALSIAANPPDLIAGDGGADLRMDLSGALGTVSGAELSLRTSAGEIGAVDAHAGGSYTARLSVDDARDARCVLVTAADRRAPHETTGQLTLAQSARKDMRFVGEPGAQLLVTVGGRERGPFEADYAGGATVEIDLPPGEEDALVVSLVNGERREKTQSLQVVPSRRVQLFPLLENLPADPSTPVTVRALAVKPSCAPLTADPVAFSASAGSFSEATHEGDGVWSAVYTPPAEGRAVTLTAELPDAGREQRDTLTLDLAPGAAWASGAPGAAGQNPVRRLLLLSAGHRLPPDGLSNVEVAALALDEYGYPVKGVDLSLVVVQGDGSLPAAGTTDDAGVVRFFYTAGREAGAVHLLVTDGARTANASLLQADADFAPELGWPAAGDAGRQALIETWTATVFAQRSPQ